MGKILIKAHMTAFRARSDTICLSAGDSPSSGFFDADEEEEGPPPPKPVKPDRLVVFILVVADDDDDDDDVADILLLKTEPMMVSPIVPPNGMAKRIRLMTAARREGHIPVACKFVGMNLIPVPTPVRAIMPANKPRLRA